MLNYLPEAVRPHVQRAISLVSGLSRPAKILAASTVVTLLLIGGYISVKSANPPYAVLFSNLEREDAASVVAKLKEMKVPYRLEGDGAVIEVPEGQARELRLELAGAGLPRGGSVGFESFDKMRLGATEFEQRILYRRALEGELSRTIGSVSAVQSARVHLVLPEKSVFVSRNEPASASVVVKLRQGRSLGGGEINSIVHLVSSSVAGLTPDRVALVSTEGSVLHKPRRPGDDSGSGSDDERSSQARSLEASLEERARQLVEKMVGPGHVDVRVSAELDTSRTERIEDRYDPSSAVVRSEERTVERNGEDNASVTGVPGAESNLPGGAGRAVADAGAPSTGTMRESHTRNFEVDHIVEKKFTAAGTLRRLTVAVVVDGVPSSATPRPREEMDKISALVRSAVGADDKRGDVVTVESIPFLVTEPVAAPAPVAASLFDLKKHWRYAAGGAGALLVGLVVLVVALRRRARRIRVKTAALIAAERPALAVSAPTDADLRELEPNADDLRRLVNERASADPATAALILRSWLGQHEAVRDQAA